MSALTAEQEAQIAALDMTDQYGGLGYRGFQNYADERTRDAFRNRQLAWAREKRQREEWAVAVWVKALTDEDLVAVVNSFDGPFDSGSFVARVEGRANEACGSCHVSGPKNLAGRLEKVAAAGDVERLKGSDAYRRWNSAHTGLGSRFTTSQWVYFTKATAAEYDERQAAGEAGVADRLARVGAAIRTINLAIEPIVSTYADDPRYGRALVTLSLEAFEAIAAALSPSEQVQP